MAVIASAEIDVELPVSEVFERFVQYGDWQHWMPKTFRPVRGPSRALQVGDRVIVRMGGALLTRLSVLRVDANREIAWRGGVPGVLVGEHSFYFDDLGGGRTRIRSEEPFTGLLPSLGPVGRTIEAQASQAGSEMLENFKRFVS